MPLFQIEQYEIHITKYRVEAKDEAEAIAKLLDGKADPIDNSLEFVEIADDFGIPVDENRALAEKLRKRGITVGNDIIPSIRKIEEE